MRTALMLAQLAFAMWVGWQLFELLFIGVRKEDI